MKRKIFLIFPVIFLAVALNNLFSWHFFESLLWLLATVLIALVFLPLAFKTEEKDVPIYQVFAPILLIPVFFSIFAIMDFNQISFLTSPQAIIYGIFTGILSLAFLMMISGSNPY